jgi:hypothetical protein
VTSKRKGRKFGSLNPIKLGDTFTMKSGRSCEVVEYISANKIKVLFQDCHFVWLRYGTLREGSYRHPLDRTVCRVGYIGLGEYSRKNSPIAYSKWRGALERVYDRKFHEKKSGSRYKGTLMHKDWHNFQNFANWFYSQEYTNGWELDKDLRSKDVAIYSADTCLLIPCSINMAILENRGYTRVYGNNRKNKPFQINISINNTKVGVGYAKTEQEAHVRYLEAKRNYVTNLVDIEDMSGSLRLKLKELIKVKYDSRINNQIRGELP